MSNSTLIAHCDTNKVTRQELALMLPPVPTTSFRPVPHIELVERLDKELQTVGLAITSMSIQIIAGLRIFVRQHGV